MPSQINASNSGFGGIVSTGDSSGVLQLQTTGTTAVTIDTSQNVGIGTSSPSYKLHVQMPSDGSAGVGFRYIGGTNNPGLFFNVNESTRVSSINASGSTSGILALQTDNVERMRITDGGLLQFNNGYGSVATAYGCRAWVSFNGTGTVAIRSSGNVSSITDNGTGTYAINFSNAMPDANYACIGSAVFSSSYFTNITSASNPQTTDIGLRVTTDAGSLVDPNWAFYAIFR